MIKSEVITKLKIALIAATVTLSAVCPVNTYAKDADKKAKTTAETENSLKDTNKEGNKSDSDAKSLTKDANTKNSNTEKKYDSTKQNTSIPSNVPVSETLKKGTYTVALDGTGDFSSIATAAVMVPSGSTLLIKEGIYNEEITIQSKLINMKGVSKETCVIQYDTCNYMHVPLNIAAGTYENLTIRGYHKNKMASVPGYAIHIDCDSLTGQQVNFNNCNIISENAFCVGIGLRKGAKIAFRGCNFTAKRQGMMLFHDSQNPSLAGQASLNIENCVINNLADGLLITQCISPASTTTLTLKNNTVIGNGDGFCLAYGSSAGNGNGWMGASNVNLSKNSAGNNIVSFNYEELLKYNAEIAEKSAQFMAVRDKDIIPENKTDNSKKYVIKDEEGREVYVSAETIDGPLSGNSSSKTETPSVTSDIQNSTNAQAAGIANPVQTEEKEVDYGVFWTDRLKMNQF